MPSPETVEERAMKEAERVAKALLRARREAWDEGRAAGFEEGLDGDAPKNPYRRSKP